ncbi:MAG: hypothetical protein KAH93_02245 [Candidatus Aenigmarchaeota archaeon]|nr:hypothetical protein [Candidatus Aenigmarchaeota archaeon]
MDALEISRMIEGYRADGRQRDIDGIELGEPYVVKGKFVDGPDDDGRLEVGRYGAESLLFEPLVQIRLGDVPEYENGRGSYLDVDGFSGTIYKLPEHDYARVEMSLLN